MSLGVPAWLWIMAAAAVPVIIHLWSRKSGKPKMLPTFRFLPEKSFARASRIELHEKTLLFLRIVLILLISLLLAGLFFDSDLPEFSSVIITESESGVNQSNENATVLELQVSPDRIDRLGWFRLIEQVEYDYSPGLIMVSGRLTADRFSGQLPFLSADLEWVAADLPDNFQGKSWSGADNNLFSYIQTRSDSLIETKIEPVDEANDGNMPDRLALTINSNLDDAQKTGFEQAAGLWKIEKTEADLPQGRIADVQYGDNEISLDGANLQNLTEEYLNAGPDFGIQLHLLVDDSIQTDRTSLRSTMKVIRKRDEMEFQLAAVPHAPYTEWFYAGVAHQLLKTVVGIDHDLHPELTNEQRQPLIREQPVKAGLTEKESAGPILLILILLVWAGERTLSNRRGM